MLRPALLMQYSPISGAAVYDSMPEMLTMAPGGVR